jgi:hypothetical protein
VRASVLRVHTLGRARKCQRQPYHQLSSFVPLSRIRIPVDLLPANDGQRGGALAGTVIPCAGSTVSSLGVILLAALAYFYGGSQVPSGQRPLRSLTAENVGKIKNEFNAANNEIRFTAALTNLNLMSAWGLCNPGSYTGVWG